MKPVKIRLLFLALLLSLSSSLLAQESSPQPGDPPQANLITLEPVDNITVGVRGAAGAVFPSARVAIRNWYTGQTVIVQASYDGSFSAEISGTPLMPYQIHAARDFSQNLAAPDPLPGSGALIYPAYDELGPHEPIPFAIGGNLAYGADAWYGDGRINKLNFAYGEVVTMSLQMRLSAPDADPTLPYTMFGTLALRRLFDEDGRQLSTAIGAGDTWSSESTSIGLPILGRHMPDVILTETQTERLFVDEETQELHFRLNFVVPLPDDLPAGVYMPVFSGQATIAGSEPFDWYTNRVFSTRGTDTAGDSGTIMPLVLKVGEPAIPQLDIQVLDMMNGWNSQPPTRIPVQPGEQAIGALLRSDFLPLSAGELTLSIQSDDQQIEMQLPVEQFRVENERFFLTKTRVDLAHYGDSQIRLDGIVTDIFGNPYAVDEQLTLLVAEPMHFSPAILPGTVFEVGDAYPTASFAMPKVERDYNLLFYTPLDEASSGEPFRLLEPVQFDASGTYVVDYDVSSVQDDGSHWQGNRHGAGVIVEPGAIASGVHGLADYDRNPQAWFDTRAYPDDVPAVLPFVNFPYFQGDVVFIPDRDDAGINPVLTGGDYQYLSIVRPDMTVRQFIRDSGASFDARVNNDDLLGEQIGAGSAGNRPEDFMFLFGGVVEGDTVRGYSALAIVTAEDSARVVPPFTEPLLYDRGEPAYMFILPTGIRPGEIITVGDTLTNVGYVAPTVPADMLTEIRTPSGDVIQTETQANTFGYFYDPQQDFVVTEPGVYQVFMQASYAGVTSAGPLTETFTGHVLGGETYPVFVVPEDTPLLETPRDPVTEVVSGQLFTINIRAPEGWSATTAYYVVRTVGQILEQGTLDTFSNQTNYQFNWPQIAQYFPNIEGRATDPADMDEIIFSFAMTGIDENGQLQIQAREFLLRGNKLYTFESN